MVWRPIAIILTGAYPKNLKTLARGIKGYFGDNKRYITLDSQLHKLEKLQKSPNLSVFASSSSFNELLQKYGSSRLQVVSRGNILAEEIYCVSKIWQIHIRIIWKPVYWALQNGHYFMLEWYVNSKCMTFISFSSILMTYMKP